MPYLVSSESLKRTPGRPKAIYGIARAAQAAGDKATAIHRYQQFLRPGRTLTLIVLKSLPQKSF